MPTLHSQRNLRRGRPVKKVVSDDDAACLAALAAAAQEGDLNCEDVHSLIDQFAECAARGKDPAVLMPLVQRHLAACPGCREEYQALLRMIAGDTPGAGE